MGTPPVGPDYEPTVGQMNHFRESTIATWAGDPKRAAQIIVDVAGLDDPPLRLLLRRRGRVRRELFPGPGGGGRTMVRRQQVR